VVTVIDRGPNAALMAAVNCAVNVVRFVTLTLLIVIPAPALTCVTPVKFVFCPAIVWV
jgi:hypothetical protein